MSFERMQNGWYCTEITERAAEFGGDDPSRIVAAAFARFLSESGTAFNWSADDHTRMCVGGWWNIVIVATQESGDTLTGDGDGQTYRLYGNTLIPGMVVLMGLTYRVGTFPTRFLLSIDEFLKGVMPHAHVA